jgi:hypothetical protein
MATTGCDQTKSDHAARRSMPQGQTAALGSLAAVSAWSAASRASASPVTSSSVVNVPISNGGTIDIDGSGVADFSFVFNNTQVLRIVGINGASNASTASSTLDTFNQYYYSAVLANGSQVDGSLTFLTSTALADNGSLTPPAALGSFSTGVRFTGTDALDHYGWLNFSFPNNTTPWTGSLAVTAGWETTPNTPITVVPEPAVAMLSGLGVVGCLAGRLLRNRVRRRR